MNSTPNYGYEKTVEVGTTVGIPAFEQIDRDIKRVEDKADKAYEQVIKHEENIKCLFQQKCDSYSKCETDRLLDGKVDKEDGCRLICEKEVQDIGAALEDRYTKEEVDMLLGDKADRQMLTPVDLALMEGLADGSVGYCYKNDAGQVFGYISLSVKDSVFEPGAVLAKLPLGYYPRRPIALDALAYVPGGKYEQSLISIRNTGEIVLDVSTVGSIIIRSNFNYLQSY